MKKLKYIKLFIVLNLLFSFNYACKKEEPNPNIKIKTVIIKNEGTFDYTGGLIYAVIDSLTYDIDINTEPTDATVYYSINGGEIQKKITDYITLDSNDKYISFFSTQEGYCMTDNNRLDFGFQNDSLPSTISIFPNPTDSLITYQFESNIRGMLNISFYNILGQQLLNSNVFLNKNTYQESFDLSSFELGVYLLKFQYGNSIHFKRIIKSG